MSDMGKTKTQLIQELEELRKVIHDSHPSGIHSDTSEKSVIHNTMMLNNILRNSKDVAIITTDTNMIISNFNPTAEKIFKYSADDAIGKSVFEVHKTKGVSVSGFEQAIKIVREKGEFNHSLMLEVKGEPHYYKSRFSTIVDKDDTIAGFSLFLTDDTHKVNSNKILEDSISLLNDSQAIAHLGSWDLNLVTNDLNCSDEVYRIFGLEPQIIQATYEMFLSYIHPEDKDKVNSIFLNSITEEEDSYKIEHRVIQYGTGAIRTVLEQYRHERDTAGNVVRSIGSIIDVTEVKRTEQALLTSREKYSNLVENLSDWVWAVDTNGVHIFTNSAIHKILGYDVDEVLEESAFPMMHPDDLEASQKMVSECVKNKHGWKNAEIRWLHKNGSIRTFESSAEPLFDSSGEIVGFTGVDRDISEQKNTEIALRKSELDLRTLFNAMTDIVFEMDYDGKYINIAPTSPDLMYKPADNSVGKTLHEVFPKSVADEFLTFIRKCIDTNKTQKIEYPLWVNDETVWFEGRATPKTSNSVLYIASDITVRKKLEEKAKHRLISLTQPKVDLGDLLLTDILDIDLLQKMQDSFAEAFNMPSIIYDIHGAYITQPSRFTAFCKLVQSTEQGLSKCEQHDGKLMQNLRENHEPGIRKKCVLGNLVTGSVPIIIQGRHLANWGIGQMISKDLDVDEIKHYANEIGVDCDLLLEAAKSLILIEESSLESAVKFLTTLSNYLSLLGLQNLQQARDISARDIAETSLLRERRLFVSGPVVVFRWRAQDGWPVEYVSPNVKNIFGVAAEDFLSGKISFSSVIYPDDLQQVSNEITEYTSANASSFEQEYRIVRADGAIRWLYDFTTVTRDEGGVVTHFEGYILDITDSKQNRVERERLMQAIEQAAETVVITDIDGNIEYVNPAFEKITGFSKELAIGQNPRILNSDTHDDSFFKELWETITAGKNWSGQIVNTKKDGSLFTEEATISPVRNQSGEIINYVAVKRDITTEVKLEEQLRQAQKMEAIGQLAGGVAHDFNNLLQVINGYTELALEGIDSSHSAFQFITEVANAGERARTLVSQLLSFSRRQIINPTDLDLNHITENLLSMIRRVIGEHIVCDFVSGHELGTIHADSGQVEQVLINLCVNSRDALPDGGRITIETGNVFIDSEYANVHPWAKPGRYVLLSVSDNGLGIEKNKLNHIFDPFFTTKSVGKGTGLGLSTVYGIIKQHNGDIQVYSEIGKGTVFKIYLPVVERKASTISHILKSPIIGGSESILIAEDDEMVRNLSRQTLIMAGYTVIEAKDGKEALNLFRKYTDKISLLFLDVVMPELGGREVFDTIQKTHPDVPVLFCSGYSQNAVHKGFILDDSLNFLQKPYGPDLLLRKIREILDSE